jgi:hypothetical protein
MSTIHRPARSRLTNKPRLGMVMLAWAFEAGVPSARVTADEAHGQVEQHDLASLLATKCNGH